MATATTAGFASYVELLTCLEMARDANNANKSPRDLKTTDAMRLRAPEVTVGVGHGRVTEGPMSGRGSR